MHKPIRRLSLQSAASVLIESEVLVTSVLGLGQGSGAGVDDALKQCKEFGKAERHHQLITAGTMLESSWNVKQGQKTMTATPMGVLVKCCAVSVHFHVALSILPSLVLLHDTGPIVMSCTSGTAIAFFARPGKS